MTIVEIGQVNKANFGIVSSTKYNYCLVSVDAPSVISSVIKEITDNSWLSSLNPIDRVSFEACMNKTVNSIIEECQKYQKQTSGGLYDYKQVGEYIVSKAGRDSLTEGFSHGFIPLAELWKEKEKSNPGFDFHSLSPSEIFIFGEAKYRSETNPYSIAKAIYTQGAFSIPNKHRGKFPLFDSKTSVKECDYDMVVYDTYDYLDKVISLSLVDPICAALEVYYLKEQDLRARALQNYIKFATNSQMEIMLLRYGFDFEDHEWLKKCISNISEQKIEFNENIATLEPEQYKLIKRFL